MSLGLWQLAEGTATHGHVMRAGEGCSDCHQCKLDALWGRPDVMIRHLWTGCSCDEPGSVGSVIKVNGSGLLRDVEQFYNHRSVILKFKNFSRHISVTKQNTQLHFKAKTPVTSLCFTISP